MCTNKWHKSRLNSLLLYISQHATAVVPPPDSSVLHRSKSVPLVLLMLMPMLMLMLIVLVLVLLRRRLYVLIRNVVRSIPSVAYSFLLRNVPHGRAVFRRHSLQGLLLLWVALFSSPLLQVGAIAAVVCLRVVGGTAITDGVNSAAAAAAVNPADFVDGERLAILAVNLLPGLENLLGLVRPCCRSALLQMWRRVGRIRRH